jgi:hypothetical protein
MQQSGGADEPSSITVAVPYIPEVYNCPPQLLYSGCCPLSHCAFLLHLPPLRRKALYVQPVQIWNCHCHILNYG